MDHTYIDENLVVDRYLMGRLTAEESERFEEHYLHCPRCLDRLEEAERFRGALRQVAAEDGARETGGPPSSERETRDGGARLLPFPARLFATPGGRGLIAAALLAAVVLPPTLLYRQLQDTREELARARRPPARTAIFSLGLERGGPGASEPSHRIRIGSEPQWIVLSLDLGSAEHDVYRAILLRDGEGGKGKELWRAEELTPDAQEALVIGFPSSLLEPGDHRVRVESVPPDTEPRPVGEFTFRVLAEE
jgi:hypothetical protein